MKTGIKWALLAILVVFVFGALLSLCDGKPKAEGKALPSTEPFPVECFHDAETFRCVKYVRNYDGDTITFNIPYVPPVFGKNISVRVSGIDAAELKTTSHCERDMGLKAKALVKELLSNAVHIELQKVGRDKYFRLDADVVVDGRSVSDILLKEGLAYRYDGGHKPKIDWCHFSLGK